MLTREYRPGTLYNHSPGEITGWLAGLELVPPGLTNARDWVPGQPTGRPRPHTGGRILAAVARKPD